MAAARIRGLGAARDATSGPVARDARISFRQAARAHAAGLLAA